MDEPVAQVQCGPVRYPVANLAEIDHVRIAIPDDCSMAQVRGAMLVVGVHAVPADQAACVSHLSHRLGVEAVLLEEPQGMRRPRVGLTRSDPVNVEASVV